MYFKVVKTGKPASLFEEVTQVVNNEVKLRRYSIRELRKMSMLRRKGWAVKCSRWLEGALTREVIEGDWESISWTEELKKICNEYYSFAGGRTDNCVIWMGKMENEIDSNKEVINEP